MCWSIEVAAVFATLETLAISSMFLRTRVGPWKGSMEPGTQRRDNLIIPMLLTINIVEWSEVFIWASHPDNNDAEGMARPCKTMNRVFTTVAGCAVFMQPTLTMVFARFTGPEGQRSMFTIPLALAMLTTAGWYLRLILGEADVAQHASTAKMALSWPRTCSYDGDHGHLEWRFALADVSVLPTMFSYHLFFNFALAFHNFPLGFIAAGGSVFVLMVEFASLEGSGEAWSVWCWTGCLFIGFYWVTNLVDIQALEIPKASVVLSAVRGTWDGEAHEAEMEAREPASPDVGSHHAVDEAADGTGQVPVVVS